MAFGARIEEVGLRPGRRESFGALQGLVELRLLNRFAVSADRFSRTVL